MFQTEWFFIGFVVVGTLIVTLYIVIEDFNDSVKKIVAGAIYVSVLVTVYVAIGPWLTDLLRRRK